MMTVKDKVKMFGTAMNGLDNLWVYELDGEFFTEKDDIEFTKCPTDCLRALRPELYEAIISFNEGI